MTCPTVEPDGLGFLLYRKGCRHCREPSCLWSTFIRTPICQFPRSNMLETCLLAKHAKFNPPSCCLSLAPLQASLPSLKRNALHRLVPRPLSDPVSQGLRTTNSKEIDIKVHSRCGTAGRGATVERHSGKDQDMSETSEKWRYSVPASLAIRAASPPVRARLRSKAY